MFAEDLVDWLKVKIAKQDKAETAMTEAHQEYIKRIEKVNMNRKRKNDPKPGDYVEITRGTPKNKLSTS